jgi:transglutaminase-like putative cysteine protease
MNKILPPALIILALLSSCGHKNHFLSDKNYRDKVHLSFEKQKDLAKNRSVELFDVFKQNLSTREQEALEFLYAFMPLSDLADYNGDFYLKNVRASFAARDTLSWGKQIPENLFRHFVLPVRVNNENLDSSRWVFYGELKNRIFHMSMKDAALEVNHWCHEKVTYKGSDGRTSAPLATVRNAYGRCGEESTFTVAALRAVCIPARQCYTPRWAHCDDNHAWVEVWVDGKWHYLGACEPEPELDMGWFSGPAKRAMLVNTNVFGDYEGPEDVLIKDSRYTRINVLSNYTETKKVFVKVTDPANKTVDSAAVEFQLYNYAEFYPLQRCYTSKSGLCSFTTGYGDLLIWAAKNNKSGSQKISVKNTDTVTITLNHNPGETYSMVYNFVPPPEKKIDRTVSDSSRNRNTKRFEFEDKVRGAYERTFIDSVKTFRLAATLKVDGDSLWQLLHKSRGNWRDLIEFVSSVPDAKKLYSFSLLNTVSEKDLHDASPEVLNDNILFSNVFVPLTSVKQVFCDNILSPRIDNEFLKPYKEFFQGKFDKNFINKGRNNPEEIVKWVKNSILIDEKANYGNSPLTPRGVYELKVADPHSRDIFFVAVCRSFGIPARLEPATRIPQYSLNDQWHDVYFNHPPATSNARGTLIVGNNKKNDQKPSYYTHFTIEKLSDGFFRSLDYEEDPALRTFPAIISIPPGSYLVVTGNRINGGTVLARLSFFNLEQNKTENQDIELRSDPTPAEVFGKIINPAGFYKIIGIGEGINKHGVIVAWLDPEKEPSRHFIADLIERKGGLEKWNGPVCLLFSTEKEKATFLSKNGGGLPHQTICFVAPTGSLEKFIGYLSTVKSTELPVVSYISSTGDVNYYSSGYKIGTGEEILRVSTQKK